MDRRIFAVVSAILFGVALVLVLVDESLDPQVLYGLGFGGAAALAVGHIIYP